MKGNIPIQKLILKMYVCDCGLKNLSNEKIKEKGVNAIFFFVSLSKT
jgi:hypothetical protein